jgi:hypothetical protein
MKGDHRIMYSRVVVCFPCGPRSSWSLSRIYIMAKARRRRKGFDSCHTF